MDEQGVGTVLRRALVGACTALLLLPGCGDSEPLTCTLQLEPGIRIQVLDAATGAAISCGSRAVIAAEGYSEVVDNPRPGATSCDDTALLEGAHELPGTYSVTVSRTGYFDWTMSGVLVGSGACHVITVTLQANMVAR